MLYSYVFELLTDEGVLRHAINLFFRTRLESILHWYSILVSDSNFFKTPPRVIAWGQGGWRDVYSSFEMEHYWGSTYPDKDDSSSSKVYVCTFGCSYRSCFLVLLSDQIRIRFLTLRRTRALHLLLLTYRYLDSLIVKLMKRRTCSRTTPDWHRGSTMASRFYILSHIRWRRKTRCGHEWQIQASHLNTTFMLSVLHLSRGREVVCEGCSGCNELVTGLWWQVWGRAVGAGRVMFSDIIKRVPVLLTLSCSSSSNNNAQ